MAARQPLPPDVKREVMLLLEVDVAAGCRLSEDQELLEEAIFDYVHDNVVEPRRRTGDDWAITGLCILEEEEEDAPPE